MSDPFRHDASEGSGRPSVVVPVPPPTALNPVAVIPSGSEPGTVCAVDLSRSVLAGVTSYGVFSAIAQVLSLLGLYSPQLFGHYGAEVAAVFTAISALVIAWVKDNQPAVATEPPPISGEVADRKE